MFVAWVLGFVLFSFLYCWGVLHRWMPCLAILPLADIVLQYWTITNSAHSNACLLVNIYCISLGYLAWAALLGHKDKLSVRSVLILMARESSKCLYQFRHPLAVCGHSGCSISPPTLKASSTESDPVGLGWKVHRPPFIFKSHGMLGETHEQCNDEYDTSSSVLIHGARELKLTARHVL